MRYDATHPTVAGLQAARSTSAFFRTEPVPGPGPEGLLVEALSSALRPGCAVVRRPIVETPRGPVTALLAVVSAGRRIAIVDGDGEDPGSERAALVLVYGTFDAVHVVRRSDLGARAPRVAAAVTDREARLFTPAGRRALALCAYGDVGAAGRAGRTDRGPVPAAADHGTPSLRMRLNRPAEWGAAFEAALAPHGYALSA